MAGKNCFIDANVLIDHVLSREPFLIQADKIFELAENGQIKSSISMISISIALFYAEKFYTYTQVKALLRRISSFCEILPANLRSILPEYSILNFGIWKMPFKTILQSPTVTKPSLLRNKKDFKKSNLAILIPEEFLATL